MRRSWARLQWRPSEESDRPCLAGFCHSDTVLVTLERCTDDDLDFYVRQVWQPVVVGRLMLSQNASKVPIVMGNAWCISDFSICFMT